MLGSVQRRRAELEAAIERERHAFERRTAAFLKVKQTFAASGHGAATYERMKESDAADDAWRVAKAEVARLNLELQREGFAALKESLQKRTGVAAPETARSVETVAADASAIAPERVAPLFQRSRRMVP